MEGFGRSPFLVVEAQPIPRGACHLVLLWLGPIRLLPPPDHLYLQLHVVAIAPFSQYAACSASRPPRVRCVSQRSHVASCERSSLAAKRVVYRPCLGEDLTVILRCHRMRGCCALAEAQRAWGFMGYERPWQPHHLYPLAELQLLS